MTNNGSRVCANQLTWTKFNDEMPPPIIDLLVRAYVDNRWVYAICFRLSEDKDPRKSLVVVGHRDPNNPNDEGKGGKHNVKYMDLNFTPTQWIVLEVNQEWDLVNKVKGYLA